MEERGQIHPKEMPVGIEAFIRHYRWHLVAEEYEKQKIKEMREHAAKEIMNRYGVKRGK
jgi:hypothetical protein